MQVILHGREIEDEMVVDAILRLYANKHIRKILEAIIDSPKSALQLSNELGIPLVLVYKKLQQLREYKLVRTSGTVNEMGRKQMLYSTKANSLMIILDGRYPMQTVVLYSGNLVNCTGCGSNDCGVYYDQRYDGLRSKCNECGANWPES